MKQKIAAVLFAVLVAMVVLGFALAVVPALAQNAVPPTAREAAAMPAFASRLARHVPPQAAGKSRGSAANRPRTPSPLDSWTYENGPINGTTDAWEINFGYVVSDTFAVPSSSTAVTGFDFGAWEFPGDSMTTVDWSITSAPNGGTVYGSGTANVTDQFISTNQYGYNIDKISVSGLNLNTGGGTFYLNLQNAVIPNGDPVYWDENSGSGCHSTGCPSQAFESAIGTIPSEAFDISGTICYYDCQPPPPPACFEPDGNLQVIHDFTEQEGGGGAVAIDNAGNVYGTTRSGGDHGLGFVYRLSPKGQDWVFTPLYSFTGSYNGEYPSSDLIVGPDGALYGTAYGGIQNCGNGGYCGLVFRLRPSPAACRTSLCTWTEDVLYRFTDGASAGAIHAFDQAGNLYGFAGGGAYGYGAVFELSPSAGGWTERVLYSFTGGADGLYPTSLLMGNDGNLYGTRRYGGDLNCRPQSGGCGIVYQLTPSPSGWAETVLYTFHNTQGDGAWPASLVEDSAGNLYGISTWAIDPPYSTGAIEFMLSPSNGKWTFTELLLIHRGFYYVDTFSSLAIDAAGNLYLAGTDFPNSGYCGGDDGDCYWYAFGHGFGAYYANTVFNAFRLAPDAAGNHLYGLTWDCGKYGHGTVWQLSP